MEITTFYPMENSIMKSWNDHRSDSHLKPFKSSIVIFSSKNFRPDVSDDKDDDIKFHEFVGKEGEGMTGEVEQMDISQPEVLSRVKREMARLRTKVDSQAVELREQEETIRALREQVMRYQAAE